MRYVWLFTMVYGVLISALLAYGSARGLIEGAGLMSTITYAAAALFFLNGWRLMFIKKREFW